MNNKIFEFKNDLVSDLYTYLFSDNMFICFNSLDDILYLIYSYKNIIIINNLLDNKIMNKINNAHENKIISFYFYLNKSNKKDLFISISFDNIKLWNVNNCECLLNLLLNPDCSFISACIMNDNNNNYIIQSTIGNDSLIVVYDFDGHTIKKIDDSSDETIFIDKYFDINLNKNYIITGNNGYVKSFDFNENALYHKYSENSNKFQNSIVITEQNEQKKLISSSGDGNIRLWDFHSGEFLNKININKNHGLFGICLWNNYLFVSVSNKSIKIISLEDDNKIINEIYGHKGPVLCIKKIIDSRLGKCLISYGKNEKIKIWKLKQNIKFL